MPQSNGGVATTSRLTLHPMQNVVTGLVGFYAFNPAGGFNDPVAGSFYACKVEDVIQGRTPTISRLIVTYRDLGLVSATFTLTGTQDAQVVGGISGVSSVTYQLGTQQATGKLMTATLGISLTAQNIQLTISRAAGAGALSIAKILMCGRIEDAEYA